jgi:hypothetical protein
MKRTVVKIIYETTGIMSLPYSRLIFQGTMTAGPTTTDGYASRKEGKTKGR